VVKLKNADNAVTFRCRCPRRATGMADGSNQRERAAVGGVRQRSKGFADIAATAAETCVIYTAAWQAAAIKDSSTAFYGSMPRT